MGTTEINEDLQWQQGHADMPPVTFPPEESGLELAPAPQPTEVTCSPREQHFLAPRGLTWISVILTHSFLWVQHTEVAAFLQAIESPWTLRLAPEALRQTAKCPGRCN